MKNVIIIGAGGHAKVIADIVAKNGDYVEGFLDSIRKKGKFLNYQIIGDNSDYNKYSDRYFIIAIGNSEARERIANEMKGVNWYTAIHPSATISKIGVKIGEGTVVMANSVINTDAHIGKHCIINTSSNIEHDNIIEDYVHISVGAKLAGHVNIGKHTWVGIGTTVSNDISICENCIIGAGAVVVKNINSSGTYVGVPAKLIHK